MTPTAAAPADATPCLPSRLLAMRVTGTSHADHARPCEDAFVFAQVEGWAVVAVADGAGSATHGGVGSEIACRVGVDALRKRIEPAALDETTGDEELLDALHHSIDTVRDELCAAADREGVPPAAFSTTLMLGLARRDLIALAHVGDGAAVIQERAPGFPARMNDETSLMTSDDADAAWLAVFSPPERGEYANETVFLPAAARARVRVRRDPVGALVLFTDGVESFALKKGRTVIGTVLAPIIACVRDSDEEQAERALSELLHSVPVRTRTDDDMTILLATWTSAEE